MKVPRQGICENTQETLLKLDSMNFWQDEKAEGSRSIEGERQAWAYSRELIARDKIPQLLIEHNMYPSHVDSTNRT